MRIYIRTNKFHNVFIKYQKNKVKRFKIFESLQYQFTLVFEGNKNLSNIRTSNYNELLKAV